VDPNVLEIAGARRRRRHRWSQVVVWIGRLAVFGMLAVALGLAVVGAAHGILKHLARAGSPRVIPVTLTPTTLDPAVILLLQPGSIRFVVRNAGDTPQRFTVHGLSVAAETDELPPGAEARLEVTFAHPGTYTLSGGAHGADAPTGTLTIQR